MGAAEFLQGLRIGSTLGDPSAWPAFDYRPCDVCFTCGHTRASHLDEPHHKGEPTVSDRGWTTRPEGSCISNRCNCLHFVEATELQVRAGLEQVRSAPPMVVIGGRYVGERS